MQQLEQLVRSLVLKVEQLDRKLKSEIDKVNSKLEDVLEEARMVYSRYLTDNVRDVWL